MTIHTDLTESDYKAYRRYALFKYRKMHLAYIPILLFFIFISWFGAEPGQTLADGIWQFIASLVTMAVVMFVFILVFRLVQRLTRTRFPGTMGPHTFEIGADAITETNRDGRTERPIAGMRRVAEEKNHFFIITAQGLGYIIPKRDLDPQGTDALREVRSKVMAAR